jgi:hypothetical protein
MINNEDEELAVELIPQPEIAYSDTSTYAQTLSNSVLAICKWETIDADERLFARMMIKRLIDAQVSLKVLYVED